MVLLEEVHQILKLGHKTLEQREKIANLLYGYRNFFSIYLSFDESPQHRDFCRLLAERVRLITLRQGEMIKIDCFKPCFCITLSGEIMIDMPINCENKPILKKDELPLKKKDRKSVSQKHKKQNDTSSVNESELSVEPSKTHNSLIASKGIPIKLIEDTITITEQQLSENSSYSSFIIIQKNELLLAQAEQKEQVHYKTQILLKAFPDVPSTRLFNLIYHFKEVRYNKGAKLYDRGDKAPFNIWIILDGEIELRANEIYSQYKQSKKQNLSEDANDPLLCSLSLKRMISLENKKKKEEKCHLNIKEEEDYLENVQSMSSIQQSKVNPDRIKKWTKYFNSNEIIKHYQQKDIAVCVVGKGEIIGLEEIVYQKENRQGSAHVISQDAILYELDEGVAFKFCQAERNSIISFLDKKMEFYKNRSLKSNQALIERPKKMQTVTEVQNECKFIMEDDKETLRSKLELLGRSQLISSQVFEECKQKLLLKNENESGKQIQQKSEKQKESGEDHYFHHYIQQDENLISNTPQSLNSILEIQESPLIQKQQLNQKQLACFGKCDSKLEFSQVLQKAVNLKKRLSSSKINQIAAGEFNSIELPNQESKKIQIIYSNLPQKDDLKIQFPQKEKISQSSIPCKVQEEKEEKFDHNRVERLLSERNYLFQKQLDLDNSNRNLDLSDQGWHLGLIARKIKENKRVLMQKVNLSEKKMKNTFKNPIFEELSTDYLAHQLKFINKRKKLLENKDKKQLETTKQNHPNILKQQNIMKYLKDNIFSKTQNQPLTSLNSDQKINHNIQGNSQEGHQSEVEHTKNKMTKEELFKDKNHIATPLKENEKIQEQNNAQLDNYKVKQDSYKNLNSEVKCNNKSKLVNNQFKNYFENSNLNQQSYDRVLRSRAQSQRLRKDKSNNQTEQSTQYCSLFLNSSSCLTSPKTVTSSRYLPTSINPTSSHMIHTFKEISSSTNDYSQLKIFSETSNFAPIHSIRSIYIQAQPSNLQNQQKKDSKLNSVNDSKEKINIQDEKRSDPLNNNIEPKEENFIANFNLNDSLDRSENFSQISPKYKERPKTDQSHFRNKLTKSSSSIQFQRYPIFNNENNEASKSQRNLSPPVKNIHMALKRQQENPMKPISQYYRSNMMKERVLTAKIRSHTPQSERSKELGKNSRLSPIPSPQNNNSCLNQQLFLTKPEEKKFESVRLIRSSKSSQSRSPNKLHLSSQYSFNNRPSSQQSTFIRASSYF